jgi:hypothetical protein
MKVSWVNLKKAENKNVASKGATKHVDDEVRGASTFDIFIFGLFQENLKLLF